MPDLRVVKIEFPNQAGDTLTGQCTLRGTHIADLLGIPASGLQVQWRDRLVSRFDGAKVAEEWAVAELTGELLGGRRLVRRRPARTPAPGWRRLGVTDELPCEPGA